MDTNYHVSEYTLGQHSELITYLAQKKFWKIIQYTAERLDENIRERYKDTNSYRMYICRGQNKEIVGTLAVYMWGVMPYYSLKYYTCSQGNNVSSFKSINNVLWTHVISEMEKLGRHSFYWCIRDYPLADLAKQETGPQIAKFVPILRRYFFNLEAVVKAGEEVPYQYYKNFIRGRTSDVNYVIKRGSLKPEYFDDLG